jgi:hypothetical protein
MKKLVFIATGIAALGLAGCNSSNQDAVTNAEVNQPAADDLNQLSSDAANDAASMNAANQQAPLNDVNAAAEDNVTNPTDAQEQNVSGM